MKTIEFIIYEIGKAFRFGFAIVGFIVVLGETLKILGLEK